MPRLPEPSESLTDPRELLLAYLEYYRDTAIHKVDGLSEVEMANGRLRSGWTPAELLNHLAFMERRWLHWGFAGLVVEDPRGDEDPASGRWRVQAGQDVFAALREVGMTTRAVVADSALTDVAHTGGRWGEDDERPTLGWILLHVLQEYARHVGHLDIVREVIDGSVGE